MKVEEIYMHRAMQLAQLGLGNVAPNPLVGCVIVHENKIIGEGYHRKYGEAHAEVNAINSVADIQKLQHATLYVNLEPCNHQGKTPPCTQLIIKNKIPKVVISNIDPNPIVAGKGIAMLKENGVEVVCNVLTDLGNEANKRFFTYHQKSRPYIILKWAQTADGYLARHNFDSKWISNSSSRVLSHKWRTEEQGILVGYHTALYDNPQLNARNWAGNNPIRIVLDTYNSLPKTHHIFDESQPTIILNNLINNAHDITNQLVENNIQSVIIEGGTKSLDIFLRANLWDEARVFTSKTTFGTGISAPVIMHNKSTRDNVMGDNLDWYYNK